jgi:hypothetical protein
MAMSLMNQKVLYKVRRDVFKRIPTQGHLFRQETNVCPTDEEASGEDKRNEPRDKNAAAQADEPTLQRKHVQIGANWIRSIESGVMPFSKKFEKHLLENNSDH